MIIVLKKNRPAIILGFVFIVIFCGSILAADTLAYKGRLPPGIIWQGTDLGGKTEAEALEIISQAQLPSTICLSDGTREWFFPPEKLGLTIDREAMVAEGMSMLANEDIWSGYRERRYLENNPYTLEAIIACHDQALNQVLEDLAAEVAVEPEEARLEIQGDLVVIAGGKNGIRLAVPETRENIITAARRMAAGQEVDQVAVVTEEWHNSRSVEELEKLGLERKMAGYATDLSNSIPNRVNNIRLATRAIDGTIVLPGEEFSFLDTVGDITAAKGYREAPVFINGELVPGIGGGVCQVSTTLYNAALLSNLEITERHNHGLAVAYVPLGLDATIAGPYLDLCFRNPYRDALLIKGSVRNGKVYFNIYGQDHGEQVKLITTDIERISPPVEEILDPSLPPGARKKIKGGSYGYRVTSWRLVYQDGELVKEEYLSRDRYRSTPVVYALGPETEPDPESPPPAEPGDGAGDTGPPQQDNPPEETGPGNQQPSQPEDQPPEA